MNQQDTGVPTTLLLQRFFICPSDNAMTSEDIREMVTPVINHVDGHDEYRAIRLRQCGDEFEVVLHAESGVAIIDQPRDSLKAVYVANGFFEKTVENMNRLRSRGTIDFEGRLQIAFMIELAAAKIDERTGELVIIEDNPPSDPVMVNRIDGEQSELFSRIEKVLVLCAVRPGQTFESGGQVEFESLTRVDVSTRREMEPIRYQYCDLESAVSLGEGVLSWPSRERHTDRYGFICLCRNTGTGSDHVPLDTGGVIGLAGSLVCQIVEARISHMEDAFRGLVAQTPQVGEIIELGKGTLQVGDDDAIGLKPEHEREIDWLDPKALYRCHLQTVRLLFLPSGSRDS